MLDKHRFCPICGAGPFRVVQSDHDHLRAKHGVTRMDLTPELIKKLREEYESRLVSQTGPRRTVKSGEEPASPVEGLNAAKQAVRERQEPVSPASSMDNLAAPKTRLLG